MRFLSWPPSLGVCILRLWWARRKISRAQKASRTRGASSNSFCELLYCGPSNPKLPTGGLPEWPGNRSSDDQPANRCDRNSEHGRKCKITLRFWLIGTRPYEKIGADHPRVESQVRTGGIFPMRIRWRIILLCLGLLLVGIIGVAVAVPYLHHLKHPAGLSQDDLTRALTHAPPKTPSAYLEPDRRLDELGRSDHIRTEADAKAYVGAFWERWDPKETNPHLAEFEERLARAEYAAVRNPHKLIPESRVVKTFNKLMDEWQMPSWTRISVPELHVFRFNPATALYPQSVARLPDQSIAPSCRPTEAVLLIFLLGYGGGNVATLPEIREQLRIRNSHFPWSFLRQVKELFSTPDIPSVAFPPSTPPERERREAQYMACRDKYFASHPISFDAVVNEVFAQLGIPQN